MKTRYAFVHFPNFCHQQTKINQPNKAVVLVKESHNILSISDLGDYEKSLGLSLGMKLATAKTIAPDLSHVIHNDIFFTKLFNKLASSCLKYSPLVAIASNYGLIINTTGCDHLFGGEKKLAQDMRDFFLSKNLNARIAFADNPVFARAQAYFAGPNISISNDYSSLKNLPLGAIFNSRAEELLAEQGLLSIGQVMRLNRAGLAKRFGLELITALDELSGAYLKPLVYLSEKKLFAADEHFLSPIESHEYFMSAIANMMDKLLHDLNQAYFSLKNLTLLIYDTNKKITKFRLESSRAHNHKNIWLELILLKTSTINFSLGIGTLKIIAHQVERLSLQQKDFANKNGDISFDQSLITDKIKTKLGDKSLFFLRINHRHIPEQSVTKVYDLNHKQAPEKISLPARPLKLFDQPIEIKAIALEPDNPPARFFFRHHAVNIVHASGPERIEHEWWHDKNPHRDYFRIEDERGKRLWIFSEGEPKRWFVHGVFC